MYDSERPTANFWFIARLFMSGPISNVKTLEVNLSWRRP